MRYIRTLLSCLCLLMLYPAWTEKSPDRTGLATVQKHADRNIPGTPSVISRTADTPARNILFIENKGQVRNQSGDPRHDILFSGSSEGMNFHLSKTGISYQLYHQEHFQLPDIDDHPSAGQTDAPDSSLTTIHRVDINWVGAGNPEVVTGHARKDVLHFYNVPAGTDPAMSVKQYESVTLKNLWQGIDLLFHARDGVLESDWLISNPEDHKNIIFEVLGAELSVDKGVLIICTPFGVIREGTLVAMQGDKTLPCSWIVEGRHVRIHVEGYDKNMPLLIDPPIRFWGTYFGGPYLDQGRASTTDKFGNAFLAGHTHSLSNIATTGAHQTTHGGSTDDGFLVKFDAYGQRLWSTYYGGIGPDLIMSCAADQAGHIYAAGYTGSLTGIATPGAHQTTQNGNYDAFLVKFDSSGVRQWGSYYGGGGFDYGIGCATDSTGNIYLSGYTYSNSNIATAGAHQSTFLYMPEAYLVKFDSAGVRIWGTYYSGNHYEFGGSCATDGQGHVYLTGSSTATSGIATTGAHQTVNGGGDYDAFLVKFDSNGVRKWGTYYGGSSHERGNFCVPDGNGNVYLAGETSSFNNIASTGAHQPANGGTTITYDAFLVKFDSMGVRQWGTYYGGNSLDWGYSCAVDESDNVYLAGTARSLNSIASPGSFQDTHGGGLDDAFLAKFSPAGIRLWGIYYGGTNEENGYSCSSGGGEQIYLAGTTSSLNAISTPGTYQAANSGGNDAFLAVFGCINSTSTQTVSVCDSMVWNGNTYKESGTYHATIPNAITCDSIMTLNLTVYNPTISTCSSYTWNGVTYTTSGVYYDTIPNGVCDSIVTLNLTINNTASYEIVSVCDSMHWNGVTYNASGIYYDTLVNSAGCDSLLTLDLTVNNSSFTTQHLTACKNFIAPGGDSVWATTGVYVDTIPTAGGCDSVMLYYLTIQNVDTTVIPGLNNLSAALNGAVYQWVDCDNNFTVLAGATSQVYTPAANGLYAVIITANNCTDTSSCYPVNWVGIPDYAGNAGMRLYPNPTTGNVILKADKEYLLLEVVVRNTLGQELFRRSYENTAEAEVVIPGPRGMYFISAEGREGRFVSRVVRQ